MFRHCYHVLDIVPKYHLLDIVPKYHLLDIVPKYHLLFKRRFFSLVHRSHWLIFAIQFSLFGFPAFCVLLCFCVYVVSVSGLSSSCVLCAQCCQCFWIVFVLCLMCPMLSVFLDSLRPVSYVPNVFSVSGLSSSCVLCVQCCQCFWIIFVLCLMCPMLSVFLDYPFLIAPSITFICSKRSLNYWLWTYLMKIIPKRVGSRALNYNLRSY